MRLLLLLPLTVHEMHQIYEFIFVAHVFEEVHEAEKGVEFLTTTREDWRGSVYEVHITWHLALYYLGKPIIHSLV